MNKKRAAGTLIHFSSIPGVHGIGDFGKEAYQFVDFLEKSGQTYWQVLPIGVTGHGYSPYQSISAFAGNYLFINLSLLVEEGLLSHSDIPKYEDKNSSITDYERVEAFKMPLLRKAFENFKNQEESKKWDCYRFGDSHSYWIDEYALFKALKDFHNGTPWYEWDEPLKTGKPEELEYWRARLGDDVYFHKFLQYLYFKQLNALKEYANSKGVKIIGDIPIFVSYDSADVWSKPYLFYLDERLRPFVVAGVPPDYFSETGQRWGNPLYRWDKMREDDYLWWRIRFELLLKQSDYIRLDHFRGFEAYWEIPADSETAINGRWVKGPGFEFFNVLKSYFTELPIIAEDLGVITPEVEELRDTYSFPGMKILQFCFGDSPKNPFLPHNHVPNSVVYTGTHDNNTLMGWFKDEVPENKATIDDIKLYISEKDGMPWDLIRTAFSSVSNTAIIPMQDFLSLGSEARMNIPGVTEGNWKWRLTSIPDDSLAEKVKNLAIIYNRVEIPK